MMPLKNWYEEGWGLKSLKESKIAKANVSKIYFLQNDIEGPQRSQFSDFIKFYFKRGNLLIT